MLLVLVATAAALYVVVAVVVVGLCRNAARGDAQMAAQRRSATRRAPRESLRLIA